MSRYTLLGLVLLVAALAVFAWRKTRDDQRELQESSFPLFEGLDPGQVLAVRIENVARDVHMRFEREPNGRGWRMLDPYEAPAQSAFIDMIVNNTLQHRGTPVPEGDRDAQRLGLEPPQRVLELEYERNGKRERQKVEVGAVEPDGLRVNVRVRGRLLRTLRDVDSNLDMELDAYRSHQALDLDARSVIEIHRRGAVLVPGHTTHSDITLDAVLDNGIWRATAPVRALLDPLVMSFLAQGATGLEVQHFEDASRALSSFGLDPPEAEFELKTFNDETAVLLFGRPDRLGSRWYGTARGGKHVWSWDHSPLDLLGQPLSELLDHSFHRLPREKIERFRLSDPTREAELVRKGQSWTVATARPGSRVFGPALPAERGKVEDLLAVIEKHYFQRFELDSQLSDAEVRGGMWVEIGGEASGGRFGAEQVDAQGTPAVRFQRDGDDIVALVDQELWELACTPVETLWSLDLKRLEEVEQVELLIAGLDQERRYVRHAKNGRWVLFGGDLEARELRDVLDPLLFLRAKAHRGEGNASDFEAPVRVTFVNQLGERTELVIGVVKHGDQTEIQVLLEGRRAVMARPDVYEKLLALLRVGPR